MLPSVVLHEPDEVVLEVLPGRAAVVLVGIFGKVHKFLGEMARLPILPFCLGLVPPSGD
jgi:hypothetical protein